MGKLPMDDQAEETPQETPVAPASLIECSITLLNEAVPFGQVTAWSLTIEGVVQWIDWDGQEQVEAKGLQPDSRPIRDSSIGSQLFPEGVVALAYPDYSQLHVPREADAGHSNAPRPGGMEHIFHMGGEEAESNECTLRILIMVIGKAWALMLHRNKEGGYIRIGVLSFRLASGLSAYFEWCAVERVTFCQSLDFNSLGLRVPDVIPDGIGYNGMIFVRMGGGRTQVLLNFFIITLFFIPSSTTTTTTTKSRLYVH